MYLNMPDSIPRATACSRPFCVIVGKDVVEIVVVLPPPAQPPPHVCEYATIKTPPQAMIRHASGTTLHNEPPSHYTGLLHSWRQHIINTTTYIVNHETITEHHITKHITELPRNEHTMKREDMIVFIRRSCSSVEI